MTLSELRSEVRKNLGYTDVTDTELNNSIDIAINYILTKDLVSEGLRPFRKSADVDTTADTEYISLSTLTGFRRIAEDGVKIKSGDDYIDLAPMNLIEMGSADTGEPSYYEVSYNGSTPRMYLRPIPDDTYTIRIYYYASPTELSSDDDEADLSVLYGDLPLIVGATWYIARQRGLYEIVKYWENEYEKEKSKLFRWQHHLKEGDIPTDYNLYL